VLPGLERDANPLPFEYPVRLYLVDGPEMFYVLVHKVTLEDVFVEGNNFGLIARVKRR
jgi:hypothetical protein